MMSIYKKFLCLQSTWLCDSDRRVSDTTTALRFAWHGTYNIIIKKKPPLCAKHGKIANYVVDKLLKCRHGTCSLQRPCGNMISNIVKQLFWPLRSLVKHRRQHKHNHHSNTLFKWHREITFFFPLSQLIFKEIKKMVTSAAFSRVKQQRL